ncbi:MAG TPA: GNAT family N-acetyltransferase [Terriglobales bacterium]
MPIEVRVAGGLAELPQLAPAWRELCDHSGLSPFMSPEWVSAHVRTFENPAQLRLLVAHQAGRLLGVLPLIAERAWFRGVYVRRLRAAANHHTLRFDFICSTGAAREPVATAMWRFLARDRGWSYLELRDTPPGGGAEALLHAAARDGCHVVRRSSPIETRALPLLATPNSTVPPGFEQTSRKFRAELRRTRRRLQALGPLQLTSTTAALAADLDDFFRLEASGWKGRPGGNAILRKPAPVRRFYEELARTTAGTGAFIMHRLRLGDETIAMSYGLRGPDSFYPMRWCYDERFAASGPGHLLIEEILNACVAERKVLFAFTGEPFEYERKWSASGTPHVFLSAFPNTLGGRLLHTLKRARPPRRTP